MGDGSEKMIVILWMTLGCLVLGAATILITFGFWLGS